MIQKVTNTIVHAFAFPFMGGNPASGNVAKEVGKSEYHDRFHQFPLGRQSVQIWLDRTVKLLINRHE